MDYSQEEWEKFEYLLGDAVERHIYILGNEHYRTEDCLSDLVYVFERLGMNEEAVCKFHCFECV